jgi:hypothetical protein
MENLISKKLFLIALLSTCCATATLLVSAGPRVRLIRDGSWGGAHVQMNVEGGKAELQFDCATASINGPLKFNSAGRFSLTGVFVREHGGPVRVDEKPNSRPARFSGVIKGYSLTLTIVLSDTGESMGTYHLIRGKQGRVMRCL